MAEATLKEIFEIDGRTCVVIEMNLPIIGTWHNGYVSTLPENKERDYSEIETDEITFSGELTHVDSTIPDKWYVGFDSVHAWNEDKPESKTFESVKGRTIALAKEMIEKKI